MKTTIAIDLLERDGICLCPPQLVLREKYFITIKGQPYTIFGYSCCVEREIKRLREEEKQ